MTSEKSATDVMSRPSDLEKDIISEHVDKLGGLEDPDAGLSEEERARIVCRFPVSDHRKRSAEPPLCPAGANLHFHSTVGSEALVETRYQTGAVAQSPLPGFFPRPVNFSVHHFNDGPKLTDDDLLEPISVMRSSMVSRKTWA